jgi:hypothetical protein
MIVLCWCRSSRAARITEVRILLQFSSYTRLAQTSQISGRRKTEKLAEKLLVGSLREFTGLSRKALHLVGLLRLAHDEGLLAELMQAALPPNRLADCFRQPTEQQSAPQT